MTETFAYATAGLIGLIIGCVFTIFAVGILRPSSYDDGWHDGYAASKEDRAEDAIDFPSVLRRHHTDTHEAVRPLPENDIAADAALASWADDLKAQGTVEIPKLELETSYPVPLAPMADLIRWLRAYFPQAVIGIRDNSVVLTTLPDTKKQVPPLVLKFANDKSQENYHKVLDGYRDMHGFRPMIVITSSTPGVGKTRLAKSILEKAHENPEPTRMPQNEDEWRSVITSAVRRGYLFLDNVTGTLDSLSLSTVLVSNQWSYRKFRTQEIETLHVDLQVVVTGHDLELSEELSRRALIIELA